MLCPHHLSLFVYTSVSQAFFSATQINLSERGENVVISKKKRGGFVRADLYFFYAR